jgi:hypothetical protein
VVVKVRVAGAEQLKVLGAELRAQGEEGKVFRRQLLAAIRTAAAPAPEAVKESARRTLPHGGGLNEFIATSRISVRNRLTGKGVGVRIVGTKSGGKNGHDLEAIDAGRVRHRVFGRWVKGIPTQEVEPGFFTKPLEETSPKVTLAVLGAIYATRRAIERS